MYGMAASKDDLVSHLFRGPEGPANGRGWKNHVGCHLFSYVCQTVLPLLQEEFDRLDDITKQAVGLSLACPPFSREELQDVIARHYTEFVTEPDRHPDNDEPDVAIVYLTNKSYIYRKAGSYSCFNYEGPTQAIVRPIVMSQQQIHINLMVQVDQVVPNTFWTTIGTTNFVVNDGASVSLNVRSLVCGYLFNKFCQPLRRNIDIPLMTKMVNFKITQGHTICSLFRCHGEEVGRNVILQGLKNAQKNNFFAKGAIPPEFITQTNTPKDRLKLKRQWELVTGLIVEGHTGHGVSDVKRTAQSAIFAEGHLRHILTAASIGITYEYIEFLMALQDAYDERRKQLFLHNSTTNAQQEKMSLPDLPEEWISNGLPDTVTRTFEL